MRIKSIYRSLAPNPICCQKAADTTLGKKNADRLYSVKYYLFAFYFVSGSRCLPYHNKLNFNEVVLYGIHHKVGGVFATCLLEDIGTVLIHSALRDK